MNVYGRSSTRPHGSLEGAFARIPLRLGLLRRNSFARATAVVAGGTAVGQVIAVLISPVLTRLYTPSNFGVLAAYASLVGILSVAASLRYEFAIPLPNDDAAALNLLALAMLLVLASSLVWAIVVMTLGNAAVATLRIPTLEPYLALVPFGVLLVGTYQALNYWAIREAAFRLIARTKIAQGVGSAAVQIGFGVAVAGPLGLLLGSLTGQAAGGRLLARPLWATRSRVASAVSIRDIRTVAGRYRRFPIYSTGSSILNSIGVLGPAILLAALYGTRVAGWYALADRVSRLPLSLVGGAVGQVYFSRAASLAHEQPKALLALYVRATRHLLLIGSLLVAATAAIAPILFAPIFGTAWETAGIYVALLAAMLIAQFVFNPLSQTLYVLEEQSLVMLLDTTRAIVALGALALPYYYGLSANWAILSFSLTMAAMYFLYWLVTLRRLHSFAAAEGVR